MIALKKFYNSYFIYVFEFSIVFQLKTFKVNFCNFLHNKIFISLPAKREGSFNLAFHRRIASNCEQLRGQYGTFLSNLVSANQCGKFCLLKPIS